MMVQILVAENENIKIFFDKNRDTAGCLNHISIHTFQLSLILGQKIIKYKQKLRADDGTNTCS